MASERFLWRELEKPLLLPAERQCSDVLPGLVVNHVDVFQERRFIAGYEVVAEDEKATWL